jgi:hypothetical protein
MPAKLAMLEEGMTWQALVGFARRTPSCWRAGKFSVEAVARHIPRAAAPARRPQPRQLFSNVVELNRGFAIHCIRPWLRRWERAIERALLSPRKAGASTKSSSTPTS